MYSTWFYFCHTAFILLHLSSLGILDSSANAIEQNLALHKQTHQSSIINDLTSSLSVDGNKDMASRCSQTAEEWSPWWTVDLQEVHKIERVKIYFDQKYVQFIWSLTVYVHNEYEGPMVICQQNINSLVHEFLSVNCGGINGQFITLQLDNIVAALDICEVEVMGEKPFRVKPGEIVTRHFCHSKHIPNQVVGTVPVRSRIECGVLCAQRYNCDAFHFETNALQKPLCHLKQLNSNVMWVSAQGEYNAC